MVNLLQYCTQTPICIIAMDKFWHMLSDLYCIRFIIRITITHNNYIIFTYLLKPLNRLCGLVVRVPGYRSRGPWFDSRRYQIF
jgi:hypothetical protein